jgi:hypothetical protein
MPNRIVGYVAVLIAGLLLGIAVDRDFRFAGVGGSDKPKAT